MERFFLGWNGPVLPAACDFLIRRHAKNGRLDMRHVVLALPGRRANNRLEEMLAERVGELADRGELDPAWYPPEFSTLGTLPEKFYERKYPIADDLTQRFAWLRAVDRMEDENFDLLARFLPHPPARTDLESRLALGKLLGNLHKELAADALDFSDVAKLCGRLHLESEKDRWETLAKIQDVYLRTLDDLDVWDLQTARLFAIKNQEAEEFERIHSDLKKQGKEFLLVGLVDMNVAQKDILNKYSDFVSAIVFAPESAKDRFDEFGCLVAERWMETDIEIDEEQIHVVEKPEHQANAVMRGIAALEGRFSGAETVVGVPDPQVIPFIEQRLEQANIVSRHFEGTPLRRSEVYRFLEALPEFFDTLSFRSLAELVRHPDVEDYVLKGREDFVDLLSELDRYHGEFLPTALDDETGDPWRELVDEDNSWRNNSFDSLRSLWRRLEELFDLKFPARDVFSSREYPSFWTKKIKNILERLYAGNEHRLVVEARKKVREAIEILNGISEKLLPKITLSETIRLLLSQLESGNIPPHEKENAVELIGWLEIVMDDAPVVFVTGMNDGIVPSFKTSDIFLPDKVRRHLGIEDNERRFARDAYSLSVILRSRDSGEKDFPLVRLIGGRRSTEGDSLLPSRLFFTADDKIVALRVREFFSPMKDEAPLILSRSLRPGREKASAFRVPDAIPLEGLPGGRPRVMRVTEFADYLQCPYRYYLKHRLRLDSLDDAAEELDARSFGTLVHEIVKQFGRSSLKDSTSPEAIADFLESALNEHVQAVYGDRSYPAVPIQIERARQRLRAFADWQAGWRAQGYRIENAELPFDEKQHGGNIFLDVDGEPMFLRARIDRIDVHEESGRRIVLDYKTSDSAADPDSTHRKKNPEGELDWIDFQLPLYHYIFRRAGYAGEISVGYITLPKDVSKAGIQQAPWPESEIRDAVERAKGIVRCIWNNRFEKIDPPPKYSEKFAAICMDDVLE